MLISNYHRIFFVFMTILVVLSLVAQAVPVGSFAKEGLPSGKIGYSYLLNKTPKYDPFKKLFSGP
ncbi:MAG: hypothetical protein AABX52_04480, partial [Nanoarchaeota archaeon]